VSTTRLAVEVDKLSRRFGDFAAVQEVSFYIPEGEIFGLLGPNGAGKTTTIRMLCGLMKPSGGRATVLGMDVMRQAEGIKKRIGYMSQAFSLYDDLTVVGNLAFYAAVYSVPRRERQARLEELVQVTNLTGLEHRLVRHLSGAMRQRLALACALVHRPDMIFLDEPTAGVDPLARRAFWDLIYSMAGQGVSVLATTHYMDEAEYCNTVGMMCAGRMVAVASPAALRARLPGVLYQLDVRPIERAQEVLEGSPGVLDTSIHGALLHVVLAEAAVEGELQPRLEAAGLEVGRIESTEPSLEDVFISLVEDRERHPAASSILAPPVED